MSDTRKTMYCGHCLRTSTFELRGEYAHRGIKYVSDVKSWYMWECLGCLHPTIVEHYYAVSVDEIIFDEKLNILYPTDKTPLNDLPETIKKRYLAVLKVENIEPSACAVLIGRTLETICNYEKASGKTLSEKLNNLVQSDRIPKTLAEMAHQLRQIRNLGAHDAEDEVTEEDVPIILDFLEAILEYLYVAPAKIAAIQTRLHKPL